MSDATRAALDAAQRDYDTAVQAEKAAGRALIDAVLQQLPNAIDRLARKATTKEPDRVRELGREGISDLHAALAAAVVNVSEKVRGKSPAPWGRGSGGATFYGVKAGIASLFTYTELAMLEDPLQKAGFAPYPKAFAVDDIAAVDAHQTLVQTAVERAQAAHAAAVKLHAAREANDRQDVADAWE